MTVGARRKRRTGADPGGRPGVAGPCTQAVRGATYRRMKVVGTTGARFQAVLPDGRAYIWLGDRALIREDAAVDE